MNTTSSVRKTSINLGMTLGEVIVALAIGAIVLALLYGTFTTTFRLGQKGLTQIERLEEARLAFDQLTRDLSGALAFARDKEGNVLFQGKKGDEVGLDNDSLLLVIGNSKAQNKGEKETGLTLQEVSYTVNLDEKKQESRIVRAVDETLNGQIETKTERGLGIGLPGVKYGLRFRYWDTQLPTGPGWVEEWMNRPGLPEQVMVIVTVQHPNEPGGTLRLQTVVKLMCS